LQTVLPAVLVKRNALDEIPRELMEILQATGKSKYSPSDSQLRQSIPKDSCVVLLKQSCRQLLLLFLKCYGTLHLFLENMVATWNGCLPVPAGEVFSLERQGRGMGEANEIMASFLVLMKGLG